MDVIKMQQISARPIEKVIVHPLVLLSIFDNYNRVAKDTRNRVVRVLLGSSYRDTVESATAKPKLFSGVKDDEDEDDSDSEQLVEFYISEEKEHVLEEKGSEMMQTSFNQEEKRKLELVLERKEEEMIKKKKKGHLHVSYDSLGNKK